jgi:hypothetical protein
MAWTDLGVNLGLHDEKPVPNYMTWTRNTVVLAYFMLLHNLYTPTFRQEVLENN